MRSASAASSACRPSSKSSQDAVLYAHASRILHLESNPGNARALVQRHGNQELWLNPPPIPLATADMDAIYELPYARRPHPVYGDGEDSGLSHDSIFGAIQRGCFGGCTFCSITEHEGRIIQSRSEDSVIREIETIRDKVAGFHRHHFRSRRPNRQYVPPALQEPGHRVRLPTAVLRVSRAFARTSIPITRRSSICTAGRAR